MNGEVGKQLVEAGMPAAQAEVIAGNTPDWTQLATKGDLNQLLWRIVQIIGLPLYLLVIGLLVDHFFLS